VTAITRTTGTVAYDITIPVPHAAHEVAAMQLEAETAGAFEDFTIDTAEEYTAVDAMLTDVVRKKDAVTKMRQSAVAPVKAGIKVVEGWFAPVLAAYERTETRLKGTMSEYRIKQHETERKARELAAVHITEGDSPALLAALATANDAATAPAGRATTTFVWVVERIAHDMVPAEYKITDEKRIAEIARTHKGDDPPVVPGVTFRRDARIGARR
jgi:hypothetical protein